MRFEEVLGEVGGFSRFQFLVLILLCLPRVILPLHFLLHIFISATPPHHCRDPSTLDLGFIHKEPEQHSSCRIHGNHTNVSALVPCPDGWVYDRSQFSSTTATQWDLVCDNKKLNQLLATFFFVGVTLGAIIFGQLSDKFGRRTMLLVSYSASLVLGVASAFSVSYVMLATLRTLCGVALTGMTITTVALCLEWTDVEHRTFTGTIVSLGWSVGSMLLALLAYLIRDWRTLMLAVTSPCIAALLSWWWIPESARWLLANGRVEEARKYLVQCAKMNGTYGNTCILEPEVLQKVAVSEVANKSHSYLDLVRTPKLRMITICSGILWFAVAFTYYGISFKVTGFGLNMYLTHFVYGAVEVPAKIGTYYALDRIGRRNGQAWSMILTGAMIGLNTAIPTDYGMVRTCVGIVGKGFSEAAFTTAFLYTAELYPTVIRQCGLGFTSFVGRLGGSLAPLVLLLEDVWTLLPPVTFALVALGAGGTVFLLPETLNVRLPENVLDVEEGRHKMNGPLATEMIPITSETPAKDQENT